MYVHQSLEEGVRAFQSGRYPEAIAFLTQALQEDPHHPDLHYWLAKAHQQMQHNTEAIAEFRQVLLTSHNSEHRRQAQQVVEQLEPNAELPIARFTQPPYLPTNLIPKGSLKSKVMLSAIALATLPMLIVVAVCCGWISVQHPELWQNERAILLIMMMGAGAIAVITAMIASVFAHRLTRAVIQTANATAKLSQGQLETRLPVISNDEFGLLGIHINHLSDWLKSLVTQLQQQVRTHKTQQEKLQHQMELLGQTLTHFAQGQFHLRFPSLEGLGIQRLSVDLNQMASQLEQVITDLRNQQKALDLSAIVSMTDRKGAITYVNHKFCEISGYSREELIGQNHRIVSSGYHPKEFFVEMWKIIASGRIWKGEIKNQNKNGEYYWVDSLLMPLFDTSNHICGYIGIRFDITERKLAEERLEKLAQERKAESDALRESEERFRLLVTDIKDYAIIMLDGNGNVISWNAGAEAIKGYKPQEIIGQHVSRFYPPEDMPQKKAECELQLAREVGRFEDEGWRVRKDGSRFWANVVVTTLQDEQGQIRGFSKVTRDVTERKLAQEKLQTMAQEQERLVQELKNRQAALDQVVTNIEDVATQVNAGPGQSISDTKELAQQAKVQADQIESALRQMERMVNTIKDVSDVAKRAEQVAQQAAATAEVGDQAVDRTVEGIHELRQTIAETSKMMKRLGEGSQQIGKIVTSISQIASQTNLLALNATIEAARAGEQGQGFAVVAEEVRKLAERSASATEEISGIVSTIQDEISRVMNAMESGTQQVVGGTQLAVEAKTNLNAIIEVSREMNNLIQNITKAAQRQAVSAEDISGTVKQVNDISVNTLRKATEVTKSLDGLAITVGKLQSSVANFRLQ